MSQKIKMLALDVDGVLTDGGFWWGSGSGPCAEEWKRFSFLDVMGVSLARKAGLRIALISGEASPLVDRFAIQMGITDVVQGCKDKAAALRTLAKRHKIALRSVAFMGDDVNDLGALKICGLPACPATAHPQVLAVARFVAKRPGGNGAVRELVDHLLI
jgi:3-deoxy-D-manno-octulosonate 8-phosphate phosphatase (KDO 8-P phosphatase)